MRQDQTDITRIQSNAREISKNRVNLFFDNTLDHMRAVLVGRTANRISRPQPVSLAPRQTAVDHFYRTITGICLPAKGIDSFDMHRILRRSIVLTERVVLSVAFRSEFFGRVRLSTNEFSGHGTRQRRFCQDLAGTSCRYSKFTPDPVESIQIPKDQSHTPKRLGFQGQKPLRNQPAFRSRTETPRDSVAWSG